MNFNIRKRVKQTATLASLVAFSAVTNIPSTSSASVASDLRIRNLADKTSEYHDIILFQDAMQNSTSYLLDETESEPKLESLIDNSKPQALYWDADKQELHVIDYPIQGCEITIYEDKNGKISYNATLPQNILIDLESSFAEQNCEGEYMRANCPGDGWFVYMKDKNRDNEPDVISMQPPQQVLKFLNGKYLEIKTGDMENNRQENDRQKNKSKKDTKRKAN